MPDNKMTKDDASRIQSSQVRKPMADELVFNSVPLRHEAVKMYQAPALLRAPNQRETETRMRLLSRARDPSRATKNRPLSGDGHRSVPAGLAMQIEAMRT